MTEFIEQVDAFHTSLQERRRRTPSGVKKIIAEIEARIREHDGKLTEDEEQYVAGLRDALAIVKKHDGVSFAAPAIT